MNNYRNSNGYGNNSNNPELGQTEGQLVRVADADYGDGANSLAGADRPSTREISNVLFDQEATTGNADNFSDFLWLWGQFIDHDITLTEKTATGETANIEVPFADASFDPFAQGGKEIPLTRSHFDAETGTGADNPRQQVNHITPFIDASNVYGSDELRAETLRADGGKLELSIGDFLPYNVDGLPNDPSTDAHLYLAGDARANENLGLTSVHTLFAREHNRLVDELSAKNPSWDDETLFQEARVIVEAQLQIITFEEFLPKLVGEDAIADWSGYDADIDPQIANEFSTAAYRLGHTMLSTTFHRVNEDGTTSEFGNLELRHAFFRPDKLSSEGGIDDILRGAGVGESEEVDLQIVDDVRNFLFGPPGAGGLDLAALNLQRGREHGLNDYNSVRESYGLQRAESFADITSDSTLQASLESLYGSVDNIDLYAGGLAEDPVEGSLLGELFQTIVVDQFVRIRDGDSYWHENRMSEDQLAAVAGVTLADIIERNSDVGTMQDDVFLAHTRIGGTEFSDMLHATGEQNLMLGEDGDDLLFGDDGDDQLEGGNGNDWLFGYAGDDIIRGGDGDDLLFGLDGADLMEGGAGNDQLLGGRGGDTIDGGDGDDLIRAGSGDDTIIFSNGADVVLEFETSQDTLDFTASETVLSMADLTINTFETGTLLSDAQGNNIWLSEVTSMASIKKLFNGTDDGDDAIMGGDQSVLEGTSGDDLFKDTNGTQYMFGGEGTDTVLVDGNRADYNINQTEDGEGFVMWTSEGHDIFWGIELIQFNDETIDLDELA